MRRNVCLMVSAACVGLTMLGCNRGNQKPPPPDLPALPIARPAEAQVSDYVDYTGRTNAKDSVTIVPRVTGYLMAMPFKEGDDVDAGAVLFEIDPRPYKAQLEASKAQEKQAFFGFKYAEATNKRFQDL